MILTYILIDLIFFEILNFPIYTIFLIFVFYNNKKLVFPIIISVILDIIMLKICLSPLVVILSLLAVAKSKMNLIKSLIYISILYFGISFYLDQLSLSVLIKLLIIIIIYLFSLKLPLKEYKLIR